MQSSESTWVDIPSVPWVVMGSLTLSPWSDHSLNPRQCKLGPTPWSWGRDSPLQTYIYKHIHLSDPHPSSICHLSPGGQPYLPLVTNWTLVRFGVRPNQVWQVLAEPNRFSSQTKLKIKCLLFIFPLIETALSELSKQSFKYVMLKLWDAI